MPIEKVVVLFDEKKVDTLWPKCEGMRASSLASGKTLQKIIEETDTDFLLIITHAHTIHISPGTLERFVDVAATTDAGMVYADYCENTHGNIKEHPLNDYQFGSIRDGFDFGNIMLFSLPAVKQALRKYGALRDVTHAGLYDLRLKVAIDHRLFHIQEFLYTKVLSENDIRQKRRFKGKALRVCRSRQHIDTKGNGRSRYGISEKHRGVSRTSL